MDSTIGAFVSGQHTILDNENIPKDASSGGYNWITKDGKIILAGGRRVVGSEGTVGKCPVLWFGYKVNGDKVLYRKITDKLQYFNGSDWVDIQTGLSDVDYSFQNYSSLAGSFTVFNSTDGFYKINNAHPDSPISLYNASKNFHGKILIDSGRTLLWDRNDANKRDRTGLYGSYIDRQDSTVYTAVTGESIGDLGSRTYTGTLAFKAGGASRNCFAITFAGTVAAGAETFTDNLDGTLKSSRAGGSGTINYATGDYSVTFSAITTGAVTAAYQWEDSTNKGIADFTKSATRLPGEGFVFPQDEGGDPILNVVIGPDGAYYSLKEKSAYRLSIDADDKNATNKVFRKDIGIPAWRACVSTGSGIVFLNTANPSKPELTILQNNPLGDAVEKYSIISHFKFSDYDYTDSYFDTYERYLMIFCKKLGNPKNDTILFINVDGKTVDVVKYNGLCSAKDGDNLYIGSPLTNSVYQILNGFDDDGLEIENYWDGRGEIFQTESLKKEKKLRIMGLIDPDQSIQVWIDTDDSGFVLVGTIVGSGSYVDYSTSQAIGVNFIGQSQLGGDDVAPAYKYFCELKLKTPKFRKRMIRFVATGIGYCDINTLMDRDVLIFEDRIPKKYRSKQNVSKDGLTTNLNNPQV
jgi:hypothetical protein